jgi:sugar lactone lactonase YvrE
MKALKRIGLAFLFITQLNLSGFAQLGFIKTIAGNGRQGFSGDGGPATSAQVNEPRGVAVDAAGNLYIADYFNGRIRKVTPAGVISTVAGGGSSLDEGVPAISARLSIPESVAVDATGNLYITDTGHHRVRKVTSAGLITTVAGNGTEGFSGDNGPATSAQLHFPSGVAIDAAGNLLIADTINSRIRRVTPAGLITTFAGNGTPGSGGDNGPATSAELLIPESLAIDADGNLYIAEYYRVRKVTPAGLITTFVGNGISGFSGDGGPAISAQLREAKGVAIDAAGNLYIGDSSNNRIRKVTPAGFISTVSGNGTSGYGGDYGPAISAQLNEPYGVAVDTAGNLYIANSGSDRIRRVEAVNVATTFFPQVAVGGGYSTLFTITNTGVASVSGNLILTDQQGNLLTVSGAFTDASGTTLPAFGSSFAIAVPAGGTVFFLASDMTAGSPTMVGWAQLQSIGGSLTALATYEYGVGGRIQTMVGVLQSPPLQSATIPVDNDDSQGKQVVYAIANPSDQSISIKLALVGQDGTVINDTVTVLLGPGQQIARYVWQDLALTKFRGSLVLRGQNGRTFFAIALLEKQGMYTVIPLIPGKAPGVPD